MIVNGQERLDVLEITVPAGVYYLGDPCYVLDGDEWNAFLGIPSHTFDTPGSRYVVALPTRYGDGMYLCEQNGEAVAELGVDSGMIGLVSITPHNNESPDGARKVTDLEIHSLALTHIVGFDKAVTVRDDDGVLIFGDYRVDTT